MAFDKDFTAQVSNVDGGTIGVVGTLLGIGGTVQVSGASAGTNVNVVTGTIQSIGSIDVIGTMPAISIGESTGGTLDIVTRIGNIGTIESGTVTTSLALNTGTISTIVAGTQNTLGTVGVVTSVSEVVKGTTTLVARTGNVGTLELGSVVVTTLPSGGTLLNLATGTLANSGTTTGVGVVTALTTGSVTITNGTVTTGSLSNVAMINAGTVVSNGGSVMIGYPSFNYRSGAGTTTIKNSAGILHGIFGTYVGNGTLYNSAGTSTDRIWGGLLTTNPQFSNINLGFGSLTWAGTGASALVIVYQ